MEILVDIQNEIKHLESKQTETIMETERINLCIQKLQYKEKKYTSEDGNNIFVQIDKLKKVLKSLEEYSEDQYRHFGFNDVESFIEDTVTFIHYEVDLEDEDEVETVRTFSQMLDLVCINLNQTLPEIQEEVA